MQQTEENLRMICVQQQPIPIDAKTVTYHEAKLEEVVDDLLDRTDDLHDNMVDYVKDHAQEHLMVKVSVSDLGEKVDRIIRFCQALDKRLEAIEKRLKNHPLL
jgi:hypothetical protein